MRCGRDLRATRGAGITIVAPPAAWAVGLGGLATLLSETSVAARTRSRRNTTSLSLSLSLLLHNVSASAAEAGAEAAAEADVEAAAGAAGASAEAAAVARPSSERRGALRAGAVGLLPVASKVAARRRIWRLRRVTSDVTDVADWQLANKWKLSTADSLLTIFCRRKPDRFLMIS